ncbi:MAG: protein kinase [Bryobacteraceae bacterium]|nr:protein kinase [Bryobacteraceae bacterium]
MGVLASVIEDGFRWHESEASASHISDIAVGRVFVWRPANFRMRRDPERNAFGQAKLSWITLMPLSPGDRLGIYDIVAPIGAGGMGEVYRARDTKLGRQVAIKVLPAHLASNPSARERLRREASAAAALDHPFICKVFEIGEAGEVLFLVMEFIAGETLHQRLASGHLPLDEALRFAAEIAEALEEAHHQRFVHRDLKPANVMIAQGHVKVMDFGLAKQFIPAAAPPGADTPTLTIGAPPLTEYGTAVGTPDYMSPEQVRGEDLDQRSDLFSFGILLCNLLGNPHPFRRSSTQETMAAILRDPPNLGSDLPQGLMLVIRRLLAKPLDVRYPSMADVRADLAMAATNTLAPARAEQHPRIPLIGREAERAELLQRLQEAMAGRGAMVMIGGEPGVGKTHLIHSVLDEARHRGAYANIGHCYEMEGSPPYVPFIEMLERTSQTAPKTTWRAALGDSAPEIARLMPELRRMYSDIPPAIELPPEQQRRYLFNAFREYLERAARNTPIVLVFEDLHWADEPTLLLMQHVAQILSATPLLLIGTYRDVDLEVNRPFAKTLEAMLRQKQATRISLRRLGVDGVEAMLAAMSGQTPPPSLARVVFAETEGNPFFVEEIFRHLEEEGKLFDETGKWRPGLRVDQLQVPEGVRLVLGRRLDRLGAGARKILTTAAVLGRSFSLRLLEALENAQPDAALDAVEEAERAHLVTAEPAGRETRYRFVHELVRQTLAETLSLPRRQRLHARVSEAIESVYASNLEAHASPLAHHLYQAGAAVDPEKTSTYLELAARKARAGAAHEEALAHIENALSLWEGEQGLRVAGLLLQKGEALRSLGRTDEAVASLEASISMFEAAGAAALMAQASISLATIQVWRLEYAAFEVTVERALECLGTEQSASRLYLLSLRAALASATGDVTRGARLWAELGSPDNLAAVVFYECSMQYERAAQSAARCSTAYLAAGEPWLTTEVAYKQGLIAFCGHPEEGAKRHADDLQLVQKVGNDNVEFAIQLRIAVDHAFRGYLRQAERETEEAWNFGEAHQLAVAFVADALRGTIAFLRGNLGEAERWFRHRIERRTYLYGWKDSSLFAMWAEAGDDRAANAWMERRWELPVPGQPNSVGAWLALERSVVGLASMGRKAEAAALRELTEELVHTGAWVSYTRFPIRTAAGIAAACAGDWAAAEEHHQTAIHQMDTAPYRICQPMAREWYARMLLDRQATGDLAQARDLLMEALAMYDVLEMPFHANRTRDRIDSLS